MQRHRIKDFKIKVIDHDTRGQSETVYLAVKDEPEDELYIFNIDTFRPNFEKPVWAKECDGYLEVFRGEGEQWSFILPSDDFNVIKTTEKERISDLCSDGLYYFSAKGRFESYFKNALNHGLTAKGEYYIAPIYNLMIEDNLKIKYDLIELESVVFCGTPQDYFELLQVFS